MSKSITVKTGDSPTLPLESTKKRTTRCVFLCYSTNLFIILCVFRLCCNHSVTFSLSVSTAASASSVASCSDSRTSVACSSSQSTRD